uniref:NADH dehydrogenase subunit 2 n=1 Tax=Asychis amphiglyptus TaxID=1931186 RepID=UPI0022DCD91B|nr:NADH dehydrogenase subunit 2 [Asychis amphiglyptus]UZZ45814.1 NADH dehydrogenase subunit 2 [Asychis amphiglyptus]
MWNLKLSSFIFMPTLVGGIFMMLSAHDWMSIWIGMEINMYSFIPMMFSTTSSKTQEATTKYFLIQAFGSGMFILGILGGFMANPYTLIILLALLLKAGMAPMHFWYPSVMNTLPWLLCLILTTLQKFGPMLLIIQSLHERTLSMSIISATNALVGAIGGLNQTQLRAILAYSSIGHMGWILAGAQFNTLVAKIYFLLYIMTISSIILIIIMAQLKSNTQPMTNSNQAHFTKPSLMALLLSLGGVPPMLGVFPKIMIISTLCSNNFIKLPIILIMSSMLNMYYYLKIFYSSYFSMSTKSFMSPPNPGPKYATIPAISISMLATSFSLILIIPLLSY